MRRLLIILFIGSCLSGISQTTILKDGDVKQLQKLNQAMYYVATRYVDPINTEEYVNKVITKALAELDPHSTFVSKEELARSQEMFAGNFEGIGIEFNVMNDTLMVVNVVNGGPAAKVGLIPGDRIISVNGQSMIGVKQNDVPKILKGPKGTIAEATIVRRGVPGTMIFKIVRDKIPMKSVNVAYFIAPKVGYIKIDRFAATTNDELQAALRSLQGAESMILDLRGNGGGLYDQAIKVTSNFIDPDKLVVYTQGNSIPRSDAHSFGTPLFPTGKLVVLVDQSSASSSEIVTGALQDWDRATIVGRRTFGKGLVQTQLPLGDGSAMRLTVAHYYTPSGRSIQRPYKMGDKTDYYKDAMERYDSGELMSDKAVVDSSLAYKTLVKGRTVYGGGGILPDVIVPIDTTMSSRYTGALARSGAFLEYIVTDLDKNRNNYLKKYPTFEDFAKGFVITPQLLEGLLALGEKKGVKRNNDQFATSKSEIENYLKALYAGRLYNDGDYYKIINQFDNRDVTKALEIIQDKRTR